MKIAVYSHTAARAGKPIFNAFCEGLTTSGEMVLDCPSGKFRDDVDCALLWSVLWLPHYDRKSVWKFYRRRNIPVIVLEVGGLLRNVTWKVGINGINRKADFANINSPPDRKQWFFHHGLPWTSWRKNNHHGPILVCSQHDLSEAWIWGDVNDWFHSVVKKIRKHDLSSQIILRPHPRWNGRITDLPRNVIIQRPRFIGNYDDFDFVPQLHTARAVVNMNSNVGTEAILHGVPVLADPSSLCYPVSLRSYSQLVEPSVFPDREQWLSDLCYTEWTADEIRQGISWKRIKPRILELSSPQHQAHTTG